MTLETIQRTLDSTRSELISEVVVVEVPSGKDYKITGIYKVYNDEKYPNGTVFITFKETQMKSALKLSTIFGVFYSAYFYIGEDSGRAIYWLMYAILCKVVSINSDDQKH